jgi:hypothetical protein
MAELGEVGLSDRMNALATDARECWQSGAFEDCLRELDEIPLARHSSETIFLRARALLRLGRSREAFDWLRLN